MIVTGPSFTSSTCIRAPKRPVAPRTLAEVLAAVLLVLSVLTLSACASSDTNEPEPITAQQFGQVEAGMTKDAVRSLLGKPARARTIENRHPITREPGKGIQATLDGTSFQVWEYLAGESSYYGVLFNTATGRVEGTYSP